MLSCRNGALYRTLTLLGLVLAFAVIACYSNAEDKVPLIYKEVVEGAVVSFPYLSPETDQRELLIQAFSAQKKMFYAITGDSGGLEALKYLAIVATMIGGMFVIFNAKYRKASVLFGWLLVVIVCLFAPYGSRLLFYPVTQNNLISTSGDSVDTSTSCDSKDNVCGFTPQLAGLHVAATLQLLFSDVFSTLGWNSLLDDVISRSALNFSPVLKASPEWLTKVDDLRRSCPANSQWKEFVGARVSQSSNAERAVGSIPRLGDVFNSLATYSQNAENSKGFSGHTYPFPAVVFYDENSAGFGQWLELAQKSDSSKTPDSSESPDSSKTSDSEGNLNAYAGGLGELLHDLTDEKTRTVMHRDDSGFDDDVNISYADALDKLAAVGFFDTGYEEGKGIYPGYFFIRAGQNSGAQAGEYRKCNMYQWARTDNVCGGVQQGYFGNGLLTYDRQVYLSSLFDGVYNLDRGRYAAMSSSYSFQKWPQIMVQLQKQSVKDIPVGIMNFSLADTERGVAGAAVPETTANAGSIPFKYDCTRDAQILMNEALEWTMGKHGRTPDLYPLRDILVDSKEFSVGFDKVAVPEVFMSVSDASQYCLNSTPEQSSGGSVDGYGECPVRLKNARDFVNGLERAYNSEASRYMLANGVQEISAQEKYKILMTLVISGIEASSRNQTSTSAAERNAEMMSSRVQVTEKNSQTLTDTGSWFASAFGNIALKVGSFFVGPLSQTVIYFLSMFVDLALMTLIVLTPILFLAALVMPSAAVGVITIPHKTPSTHFKNHAIIYVLTT